MHLRKKSKLLLANWCKVGYYNRKKELQSSGT
nr:MAG TPA: hypothetical protein [Caudoviricetes sp.]